MMWSVEDAKFIHGVGRGDLDFLDINSDGNLCLKFDDRLFPFQDLIERVRRKYSSEVGYTSTFTLRVPQFITMKIRRLNNAFESYRLREGYKGEYKPLYPVKVNQQVDCIRTILNSDIRYGLEAGSKTEMLLVVRAIGEDKNRLIFCNGVKDRDYFTISKKASEAGHNVLVCLESIPEVHLAVDFFEPGDIDLALRVKPYVKSSGHWHHSGGRYSKFGLSVQDLFEVTDILRENSLLDDVRTIHAHIGSQLTNLETNMHDFGKYMAEVFFSLKERGYRALDTIDLGGGIPVDYESLFTKDPISVYFNTVLRAIQDVCERKGAEDHPDIMTEAGRAITAQSSMILVEVIETRRLLPEIDLSDPLLARWREKIEAAQSEDAIYAIWREIIEPDTPTGDLDELLERETLVTLLKTILRKRIVQKGIHVPANLYAWIMQPDYISIGNFSVFNSCLDHVFVQQHFPVIPLSGHNKHPAATVRLVDMTCDSDGEISPFVVRHTPDEPILSKDNRFITSSRNRVITGIPVADPAEVGYFLIGLTGAYQDVLEADHNLFGDLPDVVLDFKEDGTVSLSWTCGAQPMGSMLDDVGFEDQSDIDSPYFQH